MIPTAEFLVLLSLCALDVQAKPVEDPLNGNYYEGDIRLTPEQEKYYKSNGTEVQTRTGRVDVTFRWPKGPKGNVIVPYLVDPASDFSKCLEMPNRQSTAISFYRCNNKKLHHNRRKSHSRLHLRAIYKTGKP
jgi:hypothetical protein